MLGQQARQFLFLSIASQLIFGWLQVQSEVVVSSQACSIFDRIVI